MPASSCPQTRTILVIWESSVSARTLEKARSGLYSQFEVQRGLPIGLLLKYFTQIGDSWQIARAIRAMVDFRPLNLLGDFGRLARSMRCSAAMCSSISTK